MRYSKQRTLILEAVKTEAIHPTAEQVYNKLKIACPNLSLGTVYRNLSFLADSGDIIKIEIMGNTTRYDATIKPHYHMICQKCNKIFDIPYEVANDLADRVLKITGNEITSHDIAFKGICYKCTGRKNYEQSS